MARRATSYFHSLRNDSAEGSLREATRMDWEHLMPPGHDGTEFRGQQLAICIERVEWLGKCGLLPYDDCRPYQMYWT